MQYALHSVERASRRTRATFALTFTGAGALLPDSTRFCGVNELFPFICFEPIFPPWVAKAFSPTRASKSISTVPGERGAVTAEDAERNYYLRKRLKRPGM